MNLAQLPVHCVNCGGSDDLALIGLLVAVIGVLVAAAAFGVSKRALRIADREHEEFMKQVTARAQFVLTARSANNVEGHGDTFVVPHRGSAVARIEVGLSNTGTKAAHATTLNVLVPRQLRDFRWADSAGSPIGDPPATTSETLQSEGRAQESQWLSVEIPIVKLKTSGVVRWVQFWIDWGMTEIPVRIKAQSDDLADDVEETILDYRITVEEGS